VPINSTVGYSENIYAKFSYRLKRGKKNVGVQNNQVKQIEEEFLCPLPCVTVDRIIIRHSISLIYITHVAIITRQNFQIMTAEEEIFSSTKR
jgi:hypothetical protein